MRQDGSEAMNPYFETFKMRAEAVGAEVHRFAAKPEALDFILHFLREQDIGGAPPSYAVWANRDFLNDAEKQSLSSRLQGLRFDVTRAVAAEAKVGISHMDWAIANTGTLVQDAAAVEQRLVSTLPVIHIAVLREHTIVADMPSVLRKIDPKRSGYLSMITGPSRTADIERVLTIGVHGPERVIIVVVDGIGGA